jgi:hypothetical protein
MLYISATHQWRHEQRRPVVTNRTQQPFWESFDPEPFLQKELTAFESELEEGNISDETLGLFLHETMGNLLKDLGEGIYAHDYPSSHAEGKYTPLPHHLAARYLHACAAALKRLAMIEERRISAP